MVLCMSYDLPASDADQPNLPRSVYATFYVKFAPLHPNDDQEILIRIEREYLSTFYATSALPKKTSVVKMKNHKNKWLWNESTK